MNAVDTTASREFKVLIRAGSESEAPMKVAAGKFTMIIDEPPRPAARTPDRRRSRSC